MIPFEREELKILGYSAATKKADIPIYRFPVTMREAYRSAIVDKKPIWMLTGGEVRTFCPDIIPDNRARGSVYEAGEPLKDEEKGGKDMFGVEWVYVPVAGGSMEKPGAEPLIEDACDWEDAIVWPDIDSWDWEGSAEKNREYLIGNGDYYNSLMLLNGFGFERLISFMGFENAAMALLDEDQEEELLDLLDHLSDLYCRIIDKCCDTYEGIDSILVHDDWGSQKAPFFSPAVARKFLVPGMKKVTDRIHARGKLAELHSCGNCDQLVECFIEAGWDTWIPMGHINDTQAYYEKYGDKMTFGVMPDLYDRENTSPEQVRQLAEDFVKRFGSDPNKACILNRTFYPWATPEYFAALYECSRKHFQ